MHLHIRLALVVLCFAALGCETAMLRLEPAPVVDATIASQPQVPLTSVMVLPPQGSDRGEVSALAEIERVLMTAGVRVISSGITGRIVRDSTGQRVEGGAELSDLERALVLARDSHADVLLQVAALGWVDGHRSFVREKKQFTEVELGTPLNGRDLVQVQEATFRLQARAIDVVSGEIIASFDIAQTTSRALARPTELTFQQNPTQTSGGNVTTDSPERRRQVVSQVMAAFLARVRAVPKGPAEPPPPPVQQ